MKIFLFVFLSAIWNVFAINLGYIIPADETYNVKEAIEKYRDLINPNLEGEAKFIVQSVMSHNSNVGKLKDIFDSFLKDKVQIIIAFCDKTIYEYDFVDKYENILVWCINPVSPRICKRNLISGDIIDYSVEMSIIHIIIYYLVVSLIIYQFYPNFVYIGGNDDTINEVISEQLIVLSESVGMTLIANLNHDVTTVDIKKALQLCLTYHDKDGCTIVTNANTLEFYEEILTDIGDSVADPAKKIQLGLFSGGMNNKIISQLSAQNKLHLNKVGAINSFTELPGTGNDLTDYNALNTNHYYPDLEAQIIGIMKMLKYAYEKVPSHDPFVLLTSLYNDPIDYVGGKIMLRENHYTTSNNYIVTLDNTGKHELLTSIVDLDILNGPLTIFGEANTQECSFIENIKNGITSKEIVTILFIHELSPQTIFYDRTVRIASLEAIRIINRNGGLLDKTITPLYISMNQYNNINSFLNDVNKNVIENNISAIFFSGNVSIRNSIIQSTKITNVQLFYLDYIEGNICEENVIFSGISGTNMVFETVRFIVENHLDNITIIGSTTTRGRSLVEYLKLQLKIYGKSSGISLLMKDSDNGDDGNVDLYNEAEIIINRLKQLYDISQGGLIINVAEDIFNEALYATLYRNYITIQNNWKVVSYTLDELQAYYINKVTGINMAGYSFIAHYLDLLKNEEMENIKLYFKQHFGVELPISNRFVIAYDSIHYWMKACELASSVDPLLYRKHLYQNSLNIENSPGGIYAVEYTGYSSMVLRIGRLISNTKVIIIKNNTYVHTTNIFHNDTLICSWKESSDNNRGVILKNTYLVGAIYDIKSYEGIQYLDNVQLVVDLINYDGGINGRNIDLYVDSEFNGNYTETILKLAKNPYLIGYIGTISKEERDEVSDALEMVDKLLLSPHQSVGEVTYKNIIQLNAITNQFVEFPLISFYQTHYCIIAFLTNDSIGHSIGHYIIKKSNPLGFYPNVTFVDVKSDNSDIIDNETERMLNILQSNLTSVSRCAILTFLDDMTGPFLQSIDGKYNVDNYPVVMLDYPKTQLETYFKSNTSISKSILVRRYALSITSIDAQTHLNKRIYNNVQTYKGNPYDLMSSVTTSIYNGVHAVQLVMDNSIRTSSDMRNRLYNIEIETGVGNVRLYKNNYLSNYIYLLRLINEEYKAEYYAYSVLPIYPEVWNSFDHNNEYYETDFLNSTEMILDEFIGIAFLLDVENYKTDYALYRYYLGLLEITKENLNAYIQFKKLKGELYNCPKSSSEASGLLIELNRRGFRLLIGGCDLERENYLEDALRLLNMILFYTGLNEGNRCSKDVIYVTASPNQKIIPPLLYLLNNINNEFVLLYDERFESCSKLLQNVAETLDYKIQFTSIILEKDMHNRFLRFLATIIKHFPKGIPIVFIGRPEMTDDFLSTVFTILKDEYHNSMIEITKIYPIYVFDLEKTYFSDVNIADGVYFFSPYLYNSNNQRNVEFFTNYKNYTSNSLNPTYYDAIYPTVITIISETLKSTKNVDDIDEIRSTLYKIQPQTDIGIVKLSKDNILNQGNLLGKVNIKSGLIEGITKINDLWKGEPWKVGLNEKPYYMCNEIIENNDIEIGDKVEPNTVNIGIIFPSDLSYKRNGLLLVETVISMTNYINEKIENNIIKSNCYIVPYYISISLENTTKSIEMIKKFTEYYDIDALFGGSTTELRTAINDYVMKKNKLLFYFYDYEGRECLNNVFYFANPFSTYFAIIPWIKYNYPGVGIALVFSISTTAKSIAEQIRSQCRVYGVEIINEYESPADNDDYKPLMNLIKRYSLNGCIFLSFLEGRNSVLMVKAMIEEGLKPPTYFSLSMNLDTLLIDDSFAGHFYTVTFDQNRITTNEYKSYLSILDSFFTYQTEFVQDIARPASLISIFYNMYVKGNYNSNSEVLRSLIYNNKHDTSSGEISFMSNNHIQYYIRIKEVIKSKSNDNSNNGYDQIVAFDSSIEYIPRPYESFFEDIPIYICNMIDKEVVEISKIFIGLVFKVSNKNDCGNSALNAAISALRNINDEGLLKDYLFLPKIIEYTDSVDEIVIDKVNKLLDLNNLVGIIGCTDIECKKEIQKSAIDKKKLFIYPKQSLGQECNFFTIYTGLVPNQYLSRLLQFILTLDINPNVYYVGNSDNNDTVLFFDIFSDASNGLLLHQNDLFINETYSLNAERLRSNIFAFMNDDEDSSGGVIILYLSSADTIQFLEICNDLKIDKSKWGIFAMGLEIEEITENGVTDEVFDGIHIISHYFSDVESDINVKTKEIVYHYSAIDNPSAILISTYVSVMLIKSGIIGYVNNNNNNKSDNITNIYNWNILRKYMYNQDIEFGVGTIKLEANHHINLPFFVAKYSSTTHKFETVYSKFDHAEAEAWSWYLPEYTGKECDYNGKGEIYDVKTIRILLVGSITGKDSEENKGIVDVYQLVIDEVNDLGGIKNFLLKGDMYDTQSNSDYCSSYILQYKEQYHPYLIILATDENCIKTVIDSENDATSYYLVLNQMNIGYCKANVILAGFHPTLYENILDVLINRKYDNYLLIGSSYYHITNFVSLYFKKYGYKFYDSLVFDTIITKEELTKYLNDFMKVSPKNESNIIIFVGYNPQFEILQEVITNLHLSEPYMNLISLYMYYELKKNSYIEFEGVTGYNFHSTSDENELFIKNIQQRIGSKDEITDSVERSYSALRLLIKAMNESTELSYLSIKESIFKVKYNSPEGEVSIAVNQQMKRKLIIFKVDEVGKEIITYKTGNSIEPQIYYSIDSSTYNVCDFTNDKLGERGSPVTYMVGLLYSITGEWKNVEIQIFHSILLGLSDINEMKSFGDIYVLYQLYDTKSSVEGYINGFNSFKTNNNILYVFGGSNHQTYAALAPLFETVNKTFFYTGINYNTKCYLHTFAVSKHPSQIAEISLKYIIELSTNIVLLHSDNSEYSKVVYQWIFNRFTNVSMGIVGNVVYSSANQTIRSINTILRNGGYILNILSDKKENLDFFNQMCKSQLLPDKYKVISVLIDENLIHKVDDMKCMKGNVLLDTYFESLGNDSLNELDVIALSSSFNIALHSYLGLDIRITSLHESAYSSVLVWSNAINKLSITDLYDVTKIDNIYTISNSVPSDTIDIEKNNLFSRRIYAARITEDKALVVEYGMKSVFYPVVFDQYTNMTGWFCDVTRNSKSNNNNNNNDGGYSYYSNPLYIAFLHEKDVGVKTEIYRSLVEDVALRDINDNGGVLDHKLIGVHFFPSKHLIFNEVRGIVVSNKYQIIIGCMTSYCRDEVSRYVNRNDNDMLFIHTGRDNGNACYRKTVTTGTTLAQKLPLLLGYLKDIGISNIIIIGLNDDYAKIEANEIYNKTVDAGYDVKGIYYCSPYDKEEVAKIMVNISDIVNRIGRVGVFNLFESNENQVLSEYLIVLGARFNIFNMMFFKYEPFEFTDDILNQLTGSFVISSYSTVLSETTSDVFSYTISTQFSKYSQMSESIESAYVAIQLWKSALEYAKTKTSDEIPSRAYLRISYFNVRLEAPSGSVNIEHNNHLSKSVTLFKINKNNLDLVTPRKGVKYYPSEILYGIDSVDCNFNKDEYNHQYNSVIAPLIIILAAINITFAGFISTLVSLYKHTKVIVSASPTFVHYTLVSMVLIAIEGIMFTFSPIENWICIVRVWGLALSVLFLFSIIFSKAWRINKLFNNKKLARVKIANKQLLQMIGVIMFCELVYLTIWWVADKSKPTLRLGVSYSDYLENVYLVECTQNDYFVIVQVVIMLLLFCYGGKLAWNVRNAASDFNESMSLAMTIALICVAGIIEVPLNYLMIDNPDVLLIFRGIGIELCTLFIIVIQFGSKITYIWVYEIRTTSGGGSSLSGPTDNSNKSGSKTNLAYQRNNLRNASGAKYVIEPDILKCGDMTLCSLSNPELFYLENNNNSIVSKGSRRRSAQPQTQLPQQM